MKTRSSCEETEIRLATTAAAAAMLWQSAALAPFTVSRARSRKLWSIYWDTPDFQLRDRGLTLRIRRTDDGQQIQTLKGSATNIDTRREYEVRVDNARPDLALALRLGWRGDGGTIPDSRSLRPMFETRIVRTSCEVRFDDGTLAELALDRGRITIDSRRPAASERVREIEIELLGGRASALYELAYRLVAALPSTRLLFASKSARGYQLLTGTPIPARHARDIEPTSKRNARLIGSRALAEGIGHVQGNVECARRVTDREGVHQLRVGIRRVRAAASIGRQAGLPSMSDTLKDELRWVWDMLGRSRDADVFESETWPQIANATREPVAAARRFDANIAKLRGSVHRELRRALEGRRFQFIMLSLARIAALQLEAAESASRRRRARHLLSRLLDHRARWIASVDIESLSDQQRHSVRIDAKKLRYLAEFVANLYGKRESLRYLKRLRAVQAALGSLNDVAGIEQWVERGTAALSASDRAAILRICNAYADARRPALTVELVRAWDKFAKAAPFWH